MSTDGESYSNSLEVGPSLKAVYDLLHPSAIPGWNLSPALAHPAELRSHSWGTSFSHFVHSIGCHALSKEGPTSWMDAAYWICSFVTWI